MSKPAHHIFAATLVAIGALLMTATVQAAGNPVHKQLEELAQFAKGKRIAMLTNGSAHDENGLHDADYLTAISGTTITAFFGPEHGFRGVLPDGQKTGDYIDPETSIPVYSLYGTRKAPTDEQLATLDVFVFDIPDIGARFYTYVWTMTYAMDACAANGKQFVVIDRPNPITGVHVEGAVNTTDVGLIGRIGKKAKFGIATRHGMTAGELAQLWNAEHMETKVDLHVIKAENWKREQWWDETGRPFIAPSPNMRSLAAATVYTGTCIFEGTNLSEGRGTTAPFELIGGPFIDNEMWANMLDGKKLPGVKFEPVTFTPEGRRFKGELCKGLRIVVTDREKFQPVRTGMNMLQTVKKLHPDQVKITDYAGRLMGIPDLEERFAKEDADAILKTGEPLLEEFKKIREKHLIY